MSLTGGLIFLAAVIILGVPVGLLFYFEMYVRAIILLLFALLILIPFLVVISFTNNYWGFRYAVIEKQRVITAWKKGFTLFKNNLADMRLHPHDYKERIRSEHLLLQNLFGRYQQWAKSNWIPDALHWAEPIWKKYAETIDAAYTDWESIQFKILQKGSGRYERAAEEAYVSMLDKYLKGSRGIYDIWREESGLEGAVSGWLLNGLLKKSTTLQSKGLWAAAGYLTYLNGKALLDAGMFPPPIDLYLPQINGYAGLHTILMSDEGAKFEK